MPLKNGLATQQELMTMPEAELIAKIDQAIDGAVSDWRVTLAQLYRDELVRRRQEKSEARMLAWTRNVRDLTIAILVLTLANVLVVFLHR